MYMTFYETIRKLQISNFKFIKQYQDYEVWEKNGRQVLVPTINYVPRSVIRDIFR